MENQNKIDPPLHKRNHYEPKNIHLVWKVPLWLIFVFFFSNYYSSEGLLAGKHALTLGSALSSAIIDSIVCWIIFYFLIVRYKGKLVGFLSFAGIFILIFGMSWFRLSGTIDRYNLRKVTINRLYSLIKIDLQSKFTDSLVNKVLLDEMNSYADKTADKEYNVFFVFIQNSYLSLKSFNDIVDISKITDFRNIEDDGDVNLLEKAVVNAKSANEQYFRKLNEAFPKYYKRIIDFTHPDKQYRQNVASFQTFFLSFQKMYKELYSQRNRIIDSSWVLIQYIREKEGKWKNEKGRIIFRDKPSGSRLDSAIIRIKEYIKQYHVMLDKQSSFLVKSMDMLRKDYY